MLVAQSLNAPDDQHLGGTYSKFWWNKILSNLVKVEFGG